MSRWNFMLHFRYYTGDQFDRVSHNETSKHRNYCRRVSLRAANDVVRSTDGRLVRLDRSSRFSRFAGFSEWTGMDRVRDACITDCLGHFRCLPSGPLPKSKSTVARLNILQQHCSTVGRRLLRYPE